LNINGNGSLIISSRIEGVTSGTIRLKDFFTSKGIDVVTITHPSTPFKPGDTIFKADGNVKELFKLWRISQTYLSLMCAVATSTNEIVSLAREINQDIDIVVATRKAHLGMRADEMDAIKDGGAVYHRNSLSDTILITQNHLNAISSLPAGLKSVQHKIEIEPRNKEEAYAVAGFVDMILLDHFEAETLPEIVSRLKKINPALKVGVAGNINKNNIEAIASAVDLVVLSSVLYAKPLDLTCKITKANVSSQ
jgi:nicotinate-nucleotide pyrophosphorylase (carboxylating)/molybdenum transport protein